MTHDTPGVSQRPDRLNILTWERKQEDIDSPDHQARLRGLERSANAVLGRAFTLPTRPRCIRTGY